MPESSEAVRGGGAGLSKEVVVEGGCHSERPDRRVGRVSKYTKQMSEYTEGKGSQSCAI